MHRKTHRIRGERKPPVIILFSRLVFILSLSYITLQSLWIEGVISWSPAISLFSWHSTSIAGFIVKPLIASFILPYPSISFSMLFDLLLLSVIYVPITCFIVSYTGEKAFIVLWVVMSYIAAATHGIAAHFLSPPAGLALAPYSSFANIGFGMIIFWIMMLRTSRAKPNAFLFIPISIEWIGIISFYIAIIAPLTNGALAHAVASIATGIFSYIYGVGSWQLKSRVEKLENLESGILSITTTARIRFEQFWEWKVMRHIRSINKWITSFLNNR